MDSILNKVNEDRAFFTSLGNSYPADDTVDIKKETIENVPCYWFTPDRYDENNILLYLHGGAFGMGSIESHRAMVSHFAAAFSTKILFIEYSLAPENPYPKGLTEVLKVYRELLKKYPGAKISIMGDSAGGGLTISFIHKAAQEKLPEPSYAIVISPWVNLACDTESHETRKHLDHVLTKAVLLEFAGYYAAGDLKNADAGELKFSSFPPAFILVGSNEILFDDSKLFYEKIKPLQPETKFKEYPGQPHVWTLTDISSAGALETLEDIKQFIVETTKHK